MQVDVAWALEDIFRCVEHSPFWVVSMGTIRCSRYHGSDFSDHTPYLTFSSVWHAYSCLYPAKCACYRLHLYAVCRPSDTAFESLDDRLWVTVAWLPSLLHFKERIAPVSVRTPHYSRRAWRVVTKHHGLPFAITVQRNSLGLVCSAVSSRWRSCSCAALCTVTQTQISAKARPFSPSPR